MITWKNSLPLAVLLILSTACLKNENFKSDYQGYSPALLNDDLEISDPESEGLDAVKIEAAYKLLYEDDRFVMARSLLVFRHNKLVAEAYPNSIEDRDRYANIQSCTKSITSIMAGIALQNGLFDSLETPLYSLFPDAFDSDQCKREISLADALRMQTGLEFDNNVHTLGLYQNEGNSAAFVLEQEFLYPAGEIMNYNDGAPQLVSKAVETKAGMKLAQYADEKLFAPLGISNYQWEEAKDGSSYGAFSLYLKPRDLGKIGLLLQDKGLWNNQVILDSLYLQEATIIQVAANYNHEPYGYYFWIIPAMNAYAALGHGGQFLLVVPEEELVVAYTAWPYTSGQFFDQRNDLMQMIVNSVK
ncbi:serine hydrolase domain-containing protein [Croceimicrobium sp.]|uniref:serine hydrolase domain-containing protein n=1 Tax=Croceimicrobium sp. TaxID=2828340 RepID=UPI003BA9B3E3